MFIWWRIAAVVFRLYGARVNTTVVQRLTNFRSERHEVVVARRHHMHRRNDLVFGQLPHVELVQRKHALDVQDRRTHFVKRNGRWHTLEQDK